MKNYDYIGQILNKLKEIFSLRELINFLKETIYIYVFCKCKLKKELREIKVSQESQIPDIRSISKRPKEDRTIPGNCKRNLIIGAENKIATLVEPRY